MKKISELLPYKVDINKCNKSTSEYTEAYYQNKIIDQATKALDSIDPTKIRFKAKRMHDDYIVKGFYCLNENRHYMHVPRHENIGEFVKYLIEPSTLTVLVEE